MIQPWVSAGYADTFHIETEESAQYCANTFIAICGATGKANIARILGEFPRCRECQELKLKEITQSGLSSNMPPAAQCENGVAVGKQQPRDSDPLQELLLYSSFFNPHTPEKCDCGELVVRHCRCGKGVCQRHGYQLEQGEPGTPILCGECKGTEDCELWGELSYGRAEAR